MQWLTANCDILGLCFRVKPSEYLVHFTQSFLKVLPGLPGCSQLFYAASNSCVQLSAQTVCGVVTMSVDSQLN